MSEYINPPIGVSPHWFVYNKRITELSEAITRYAKFTMEYNACRNSIYDYEIISKWAAEIKMLAEMEIPLLTADKKEGKK